MYQNVCVDVRIRGKEALARGTPGVPILFACKLDTQSHAKAHSCGRGINCWQRDADKAMMGPPRKMPSRPSASRFLSFDKAERSSSPPPRNFQRTRSVHGRSATTSNQAKLLENTIEKWISTTTETNYVTVMTMNAPTLS
ncbi:unnamed protein product [Caenorhabditis auriculariae]|uniref:Uncharacterized protein n=1 Tax=Caenorhabditis auriculariae TaxID=2777116 RepID=A0A8S1HJ39_9PELO|nr:unnamed protein product [Caenorhabditis auriculariae]